jgi:hypothetical protein
MPAITGCTTLQLSPNPNYRVIVITTPATADSADTIDVSDATVTGGDTFKTVYGVLGAFDNTTGDAVTCTWSTTTLTIDAAGGTTNHTYRIVVLGV